MARGLRMATPALVEMLAQDAERKEPPPPGPPAEPLQPIVRFRPPPPDWRAEEAERVVELEPPESLQARPAGKRAKVTRTPNLDTVRGWRR